MRRVGVVSSVVVRRSSGYTGNCAWVKKTVEDIQALAGPKNVHWCDGSDKEAKQLVETMIRSKTLEQLNSTKRPNSYLARSDPRDVARVEKQTYVCWKNQEDSGPNNNWMEPEKMKSELRSVFRGAMKGRTMYVVPFSMGPLSSPLSKLGLQVTDSPYVALSMRVMTRMGSGALKRIEEQQGRGVVPCVHSVGHPLADGAADVPWPCNEKKLIVHFPEERSIWSYGSGYGGNALLGKKCLALRIASVMARDEGWFAEHMLILALTSPSGKKYHVAAAFPSACGKTNLAMIRPTIPGWEVQTIGDDISWMRFKEDDRLYAINPEAGFFGVAPGTSMSTNPAAMATVERDTIFTNVARTDDGDVWWEGMGPKPAHLIDWKGKDWTPASTEPAAHPNSRFCVSISRCPTAAPHWDDPAGVPIDAILFGGRRATTVPLVTEAFSWNHGVFMGATIASEQTAAAEGTVGSLRHDPFAMLPFAGYNMADYFGHWLNMGHKHRGAALPRLFQVNWFRKDAGGKFLWPGFGENSRVLKWICERLEEAPASEGKLAQRTPIGFLPKDGALDVSGLKLEKPALKELFAVDRDACRKDLDYARHYFQQFGNRLPAALTKELDDQEKRLKQ